MKGYEKIEIYKRSFEASVAVYRMTDKYPAKRSSLADQLERASYSIPTNIAEGYAKRDSQAEYRRYLRMSIGSANEMNVLIDLSYRLGLIDEETHKKAAGEYDEIGRMLNKYIQTVGEHI